MKNSLITIIITNLVLYGISETLAQSILCYRNDQPMINYKLHESSGRNNNNGIVLHSGIDDLEEGHVEEEEDNNNDDVVVIPLSFSNLIVWQGLCVGVLLWDFVNVFGINSYKFILKSQNLLKF